MYKLFHEKHKYYLNHKIILPNNNTLTFLVN